MKPVVVVSETLSERAVQWLRDRAELRWATPENVGEIIRDADGLIVRTYTQVNGQLLDAAPNLKVVGRAGVALENIDVPACRSRGVEVVHTPAANTLAVVDYTIRMIIEMNRRFWPLDGYVSSERFHEIRKQRYGRFLSDCTLGIIGCGRIGGRVGRAAAGLGMAVLYNDIRDIELDYRAVAVDKPTLYAESDIITVHTPLTELTRKLINRSTLEQFREGAQFINAARGPIVDYAALAEAMRSGKLDACVIDCHDPEPPPADYPMFHLGEAQERAILTPHTAARVPKAMENMSDVVHDVMAVLEGRQPEYPAEREQ